MYLYICVTSDLIYSLSVILNTYVPTASTQLLNVFSFQKTFQ